MGKNLKSSFDTILFADIIILSFFGLIMIFSASAPSAFTLHKNSFYFVQKQLIWTVLGFGALFFFASFDYKNLKKWSGMIYIANFIALALVLIIGSEINGAKRWISLGFTTIQPSEFTKIAIIITVAKYFTTIKSSEQTYKTAYLPLAGLLAPCALLIFQPHFSAIIIIGMTVFGMLMVYGYKFKFYGPLIAIGVPSACALVFSSPYRLQRVTAFLDPFKDKLGDGWQIVQSLYAIGSGGILGLGLSRSKQKHLYIPEPQNDFIFSIICEELGLIGAIIVIALFAVLIWRCIVIATSCKDEFGTYLAFGMGFLIIVQVILNIAVATSSIPPTGVPLPFFSAGGSSFLFQMIAMGIVLNISRQRG